MTRMATQADSQSAGPTAGRTEFLAGKAGIFEPYAGRIERGLSIVLCLIILAIVLRWWIPGIFSSYWLDETASLWVTGGGVWQIVHRVFVFPQSLAHSFLMGLAGSLLGSSPIVFHLLSLTASCFTAFGIYRLALPRLPLSGAFLAVVLWATADYNYSLVTEARCYAFAMAASVACAWQAERWLENPSWLNTCLLGFGGVLPSYFFSPDIVILGSVVLYALVRYPRLRNVPLGRIYGIIGIWAFFSAIPVTHYLAVSRIWSIHGHRFLQPESRFSLAWELVPMRVAVSYVVACAFGLALPGSRTADRKDHQELVVLSLVFGAVLPCVLFVASKRGEIHWMARYLCSITPFSALLQATLLTSIRPIPARLLALTVLATFAVPSAFFAPTWKFDRYGRSYETAISEVRAQLEQPGTTLIGASEYDEGRIWTFPVSDDDRSWLMSPVTTLIPEAKPIVIPFQSRQAGKAYWEATIPELRKLDRVVYFGAPVPDWLDGVYSGGAWVKSVLLSRKEWEVVTYTRRP